MNFHELVNSTRTCRRFDASRELEAGTLEWLVDCARLTPSAGNLQPLRFLAVQTPAMRAKFFPGVIWAAYLKDWSGPVEAERPTGYIVILTPSKEDGKPSNYTYVDMGIAAETIQLAARSKGLASCIFLSFQDKVIREALDVPAGHDILSVIAIGTPVEEVKLVPIGADGSVKYYRDEKGVHFVPKRELKDILLRKF